MAKQYRVVVAFDFAAKKDAMTVEKACNDAASEDWQLITATATSQPGNTARLLLFFERDQT